MPDLRPVLLATVLSLSVLAASAGAESQTVGGKGDIKKMVAENARSEVRAKVFGLQNKCQAKQFNIDILWAKNPAYQVQAACTAGTTWTKGLYYTSDRSDGLATKRVHCPGFSLTYNAARHFWRAVVPRSCIGKAPDKVRVRAEGVNYAGSPIPGEAGPTRLLRRG